MKKSFKYSNTLIAVCILFLMCSVSLKSENKLTERMQIIVMQNDPIMMFAKSELHEFLLQAQTELSKTNQCLTKNYKFVLRIDKKMNPYSFKVSSKREGVNQIVELSGPNSTCILHSLYTMLEQIGFQYEITGSIIKDSGINLNRIDSFTTEIHPKVQNRGIRQHINFPMDISSYTLLDAKEYIRNIARMRFNSITFHSYNNQWIETPLAGKFFYGERHNLPNDTLITNHINNKKTFCIPELEPYFDQPEELSNRSIAWLLEVMKECKRVGLRIQFSVEPYAVSKDVNEVMRKCDKILKNYPLIDNLEFITSESFYGGETVKNEENRKFIAENIGTEILNDEAIQTALIKENNVTFNNVLKEVWHINNCILAYRKNHNIPMSFGVYCISPEIVDASMSIMRKIAPADVQFAILAEHGAQAVTNSLLKIKFTAADWKRTMIYSWIEFDGLMYLQQNCLTGIRAMFDDARKTMNDEPLYGVCFIHWRTEENRTTGRYSSEVTLNTKLTEVEFYKEYAKNLGIGDAVKYAEAMQLLNDADTRSGIELPNLGFCFLPCWTWYWGGKPGLENLGYFGMWEPNILKKSQADYDKSHSLLNICLDKTNSAEGRKYLLFLGNRLLATSLYIDAMHKGTEIQPVFLNRNPSSFTNQDRDKIQKVCNESKQLFRKYLEVWTQSMPDRGCEGTLISAYITIPGYCDNLINKYCNNMNTEKRNAGVDAPPSPIQPK